MATHDATETLVPPGAAGENLLDFLRSHGATVQAPCGGRGKCGKCKVTILSGDFHLAGQPRAIIPPGMAVPACRVLCGAAGGVISTAALPAAAASPEPPLTPSAAAPTPRRLGVAFDIGTTTLAAALVDLDRGAALAETSRLNPQAGFGADVMSRVSAAASPTALAEMQRLAASAATEMAEVLLAEVGAGGQSIERLVAVGNPAMAHIFCGVSPEGLGKHPFTPAFTATRRLDGREIGVPAGEVVIPASASAFIGSDVLAGFFATGLAGRTATTLFIDLGTNGEMALVAPPSQTILTASAAAGPALEGASISCGAGGIAGAVFSASRSEDGQGISFRTIGGGPPVGICGSGLLDILALLLDAGAVKRDGYLPCGAFTVDPSGKIAISQKDVREFQLAKAAVRAGIEMLLETADLSAEAVSSVLLAGGLGRWINPDAALATGLLPREFAGKCEAVGNTALAGAVACLRDGGAVGEIERLAARCENVSLAGSDAFAQRFVAAMPFP